jgi:hypothetical protein
VVQAGCSQTVAENAARGGTQTTCFHQDYLKSWVKGTDFRYDIIGFGGAVKLSEGDSLE